MKPVCYTLTITVTVVYLGKRRVKQGTTADVVWNFLWGRDLSNQTEMLLIDIEVKWVEVFVSLLQCASFI